MPDWIADGWDWLLHALNANREVPADRLLARLLLAFVLGCAIALLYRLTHRRGAPEATNFVTTLRFAASTTLRVDATFACSYVESGLSKRIPARWITAEAP